MGSDAAFANGATKRWIEQSLLDVKWRQSRTYLASSGGAADPPPEDKNVTILGLSGDGFALHIVRPPDGFRYYLLFARINRLLPGLFTSIDHNSQFNPPPTHDSTEKRRPAFLAQPRE
jgi:hypothetical protein